MTIGELVFWYGLIFFVLVAAFVVSLVRYKAKSRPESAPRSWPFLSQWRSFMAPVKSPWFRGEFWLKVLVATFIGLSAGVIIAVFILPYGTALALGALLATLAALIFFVPKLLI